jgi:aspartyl aminopeptidase
MNIPATTRAHAQDLLDFIDASPSPWHAVATCEPACRRPVFAAWKRPTVGFWRPVAAITSCAAAPRSSPSSSAAAAAETGLRLIGAHTDSPGLRLKPKPAEDAAGMVRLGVEVYGGPILATFADRDLSLAGRVNVRVPGGFETRLVRFADPLLRLPNLAIHMNREVNENGLKFNKQTELPLLLGVAEDGSKAEARFRQPIAALLGSSRTPC